MNKNLKFVLLYFGLALVGLIFLVLEWNFGMQRPMAIGINMGLLIVGSAIGLIFVEKLLNDKGDDK